MKRLILRRILAVLMMLAGVGGLFTVFWLLPWMVRSQDLEWLEQHSEQALWESTQDRIRKLGWQHDDSGLVGAYGDKVWAEWIIGRLPQEGDPRGCGCGHKVQALEAITNFSFRADDSPPWKEELPVWLDWWEENQGKSQEEWVVEGFAAVGVTVHNPPVKKDWPALLKVLGYQNPKIVNGRQEEGHEQPGHLYRNAWRCLRDSGFDAVKFALEEEITPELKDGLLKYSGLHIHSGYTEGREPGRLFGRGARGALFGVVHPWLEPEFRWGWGSASTLLLLAGFWLWWNPPRWVRALWKGLLPDV